MGSDRPTYPVTEDVLYALAARPSLKGMQQLRRLRLGGVSELRIVGVLNELHYEHLRLLVDQIESCILNAGDIGRKLLQARDRDAFRHALAEFSLFRHLHRTLGERVAAVKETPEAPNVDIEIRCCSGIAMIEVYSPSDFTGNQAFEDELHSRLKRLDVQCGYFLSARVTVPSNADDPTRHLLYVYRMPHESGVPIWAGTFQEEVESWIATARVGETFSFVGPKGIVSIEITLDEWLEDERVRSVDVNFPTKSTDTRLYFEVGDVETTARGPWGSKLSGKLAKRQAGNPSSDRLRMLVVNFALADSAERDFICKPHIAARLDKVIRFLVKGRPLPYDVVLPAHLGLVTGFGSAVVLDEPRQEEIEEFIRCAALDVRVAPYEQEDGPDWVEHQGER